MVAQHLLLVRHAQPQIASDIPAREWPLSHEGKEQAAQLAERLTAAYHPVAIVSSDEPKAAETANILADRFGLTAQLIAGLREHERPEAHWLSREQFVATLADFFARPDDLVFGAETASQARQRFTSAVARVQENSPEGDIVVVTHGTVLTLFMAAATDAEPMPFWYALDLPALVALPRPPARSSPRSL